MHISKQEESPRTVWNKADSRFEWKLKIFVEGGKENGGKAKNCNRIKDGNGRLALEEIEVKMICKEYFEGLYIIDLYNHSSVQR